MEKNRRIKLILIFIAIMAIAILLEMQSTWMLTRSNARHSTSLLLNQIETVLQNNDEEEEDRTEELKETYISYAQTVAYILDLDPDTIYNIDELKKIADFQQIDEIHIFDESGTIIAGTVPEYYGYSFDSGEQMGYFKPMLEDKTLAMCQDVTPNTAEGKSMMYAIVWNQEGTQMIQIGVEPIRLLEELKDNEISNVIGKIPTAEGQNIYVVDAQTNEILASTDTEETGSKTSAEFGEAIASGQTNSGQGIIRQNGKSYYCSYKPISGYIVATTYDMGTNASGMMLSVIAIAVFILIAGLGILFLLNRLYGSEEKLKAAREKAEAANNAKTAFLFNMSHDIRTPMNAIIGYTDLIEKHYDDKEKCMDYLHKTQQSNQFLLSLINDVLEMARIESGKAELEEVVSPVGGIAREVSDIFEDQMKQKGITYVSHVETTTEVAFYDQAKTREIYLNILSNALKYTPVGGTVSLQVNEISWDKPGYIGIKAVFSDTGIGMSQEFLPHLFESFSRERTATESRQQGTGLGMPIVKKILDLMGGTIEVESEPGKGSVFIVTYPLKVEGASPVEKKEDRDTEIADFSGKRILLAEDNDLNAEIATEILSEAGFLTERAEDGQICIDMLQKSEDGYYDLILMDIQMPNLNGYEATKQIRILPDRAKAEIPIIAMTANAFESDRQDAFAAGMNEHIAKPIEISKLMETLAVILK